MDITIHLTPEQREKLAYIQQHTQQDITTLLNQMINDQYNQLQMSQGDPLKTLKDSGFIGCGEGDPNLSVHYQEILNQEWSNSNDYR
ncbi:MAG: hypothetical protein F6K03_05775 [Kamptonema sp. SIO4C4]|nr:hypothetical protein [Kamptonema sp. SIO4C4]